jgi:transposase
MPAGGQGVLPFSRQHSLLFPRLQMSPTQSAGPAPLWPTICTVIADAGHESRKLARLLRGNGWSLKIVKRKQRAFKVAGLTWIVERSFAWLGFNRRLSKDYERYVQTSETLLDIAAICLMLNRRSWMNFSHSLSENVGHRLAITANCGQMIAEVFLTAAIEVPLMKSRRQAKVRYPGGLPKGGFRPPFGLATSSA